MECRYIARKVLSTTPLKWSGKLRSIPALKLDFGCLNGFSSTPTKTMSEATSTASDLEPSIRSARTSRHDLSDPWERIRCLTSISKTHLGIEDALKVPKFQVLWGGTICTDQLIGEINKLCSGVDLTLTNKLHGIVVKIAFAGHRDTNQYMLLLFVEDFGNLPIGSKVQKAWHVCLSIPNC